MIRTTLSTILLGMSVATRLVAAEPSLLDKLMGKHPHGIPWHVEILDADGKAQGSLDLVITTLHAHSCLGDIGGDGLRVEFTKIDALPSTLHVQSYGVAKISGDAIKIDLTGGLCDAYLLMSGPLAADGSSSGDVYTFGMRGGHDVAKYRATVK